MAASAPERVMVLMPRGRPLAPLLLIVNVLGVVTDDTATLPNEADAGVMLIVETPLPVRGRVTGVSPVAATVTLAVLAPMVVGVKVTEKLQGCPAISVAGRQVPLFTWNMAASVPERVIVLIVRLPLTAMLVMVNMLGGEVTLNAIFPREADAGETLMA
jgi:hypothetical protein